ncbi:hypothetical protein [Microbacterium sp. P04]|uniref:hypothetical protein n=1 Tax=Microbacterium sp. P04 TaxID=3366947 RepID=UPI003745D8AA
MSDVDPFRGVHRARRRRTVGLTLTGAVAASALAAVTWLVPAAVADQTAAAAPAVVVTAAETAVTPAAPVEPAQAAVLAAPPPETGVLAAPPSEIIAPLPDTPRELAIAIDTDGYQTELDRCLWVRMDLAGASAPIVGAHNDCGGEVVLELRVGDVVALTGTRLDGRYVVTGSRDGRPGQDAAEATAGFTASVILQTCYFDGPDVRLVALAPLV